LLWDVEIVRFLHGGFSLFLSFCHAASLGVSVLFLVAD
jgi:hypothetical protein